MQNFNINLTLTGDILTVDYNDGTDTETYPVHSMNQLRAIVSDILCVTQTPEV